jgi:long-chain acyl-CoA synthetase
MTVQPWFKSYDEGVQHTLAPYPDRTLVDELAAGARDRPDHPAIRFKGKTITYAELDALSDAFGAALASLGVRRGDRVAVVLPNCPQFLITQFGAWKAGAIIAPLNPIYNEQELVGPLAATGAETLIVLNRFYDRVKRVQPATAVRRVIATNIKEFLPGVLRALYTLLKERKEGDRITLAAGDLRFPDLLRRFSGASRPPVTLTATDPASILMSGGTTGVPKGVVAVHGAYLTSAKQLRSWLAGRLEDWKEVFLIPLPLFHTYAMHGVQSIALLSRSTMVLVPNPRDLVDLLKTINRERPTFLCGVPTLYNGILNHPLTRAGKVRFDSLKICSCGAAPLMAETRRRFEELTGTHIMEGYSLSEAAMACVFNPLSGENKLGSVGLPLPDVEIRIVDSDTGAGPLPTGQVGEILLRAPQIMSGYWQAPPGTDDMLRPHGEGKPWLWTADLGYLDDDGYLFIVDRKKDLIKCSGYQVWPREVEEVIATHPAVAEVGVAGVPDAAKGEAVKAWVVVRPGAALGVDEVRAYCKERLAPYKVPSQVEFRTELPKSMIGKVLRRLLVADEAKVAS